MIILTNDDGIDAPGLRSLQQAVADKGNHCLIVAPLHHHSGCSHQVTTHRPLQIAQRMPTEYAVDGTPADCTRVALKHLAPQAKIVLSGVNAGGNLGADIYVSGTVAAVREAVLHRVPGIAISHYVERGRSIDWMLATELTQRVLDLLLATPIELGSFWNVNLPHWKTGDPEPEIIFCPLCTQPLPSEFRAMGDCLHYAGEYGKRMRDCGSDVEVCFSGNIAVTRIQLFGKT